jgi:hypothetical protein
VLKYLAALIDFQAEVMLVGFRSPAAPQFDFKFRGRVRERGKGRGNSCTETVGCNGIEGA